MWLQIKSFIRTMIRIIRWQERNLEEMKICPSNYTRDIIRTQWQHLNFGAGTPRECFGVKRNEDEVNNEESWFKEEIQYEDPQTGRNKER